MSAAAKTSLVFLPIALLACSGDEPETTIPLPDLEIGVCGRYEIKKISAGPEIAAWDGAGVVVHNGLFWLFGGWNPLTTVFPEKTSNAVWISSDSRAWVNVKENSYLDFNSFDLSKDCAGRHLHGFSSFKNALWIVGGDALSGSNQNDVWRSTNGVDWTLVSADTEWSGRSTQTVVTFNHEMFVLGGQTLSQLTGQPRFFITMSGAQMTAKIGSNWLR